MDHSFDLSEASKKKKITGINADFCIKHSHIKLHPQHNISHRSPNMSVNFYRPKRSFGQGNIFTPVCHSVHRGGYLTRYTPRDQVHPPRTRYPPDQVHPPRPGTHPPGPGRPPRPGTPPPGPGTPPRSGTPPGLGTPPGTRYTPPGLQTPEYGQRSAGTHPTGMHSCFPCILLMCVSDHVSHMLYANTSYLNK